MNGNNECGHLPYADIAGRSAAGEGARNTARTDERWRRAARLRTSGVRGAVMMAAIVGLTVAGCGRSDTTPKPAEPPKPGAGAAAPQEPAPPAATVGGTGVPRAGDDRAFVTDAALDGLLFVEAGRLVAEKSGNPAVRSYAQEVVRRHAAANEELKRLAAARGVPVPVVLDGAAAAHFDRLKGLSGAEFDRSFVQDFGVAGHDREIQLFERQGRESKDPELRDFATQQVPGWRDLRTLAAQLQLPERKAGG